LQLEVNDLFAVVAHANDPSLNHRTTVVHARYGGNISAIDETFGRGSRREQSMVMGPQRYNGNGTLATTSGC
jgi:hypothetical protein